MSREAHHDEKTDTALQAADKELKARRGSGGEADQLQRCINARTHFQKGEILYCGHCGHPRRR